MPATIKSSKTDMGTNPVSLSQLGSLIRQTIALNMPDSYWVVAEIAELREHRNGHCYLELIEKDSTSNQITARMKANIWSYSYRLLKPYFETTTRQQLMPGIKVLVKGTVEYQETFGLSFNIKDIDPSFTLGDIERRRRQIVEQLQSEGVLDMNKELFLPTVIQKIAIVSSPTAAGYEDFVNQLTNNKAGIKYYPKLFPAIMQGEQTEASVIDALDRIFAHEALFDIVAIVRGGGAAADLMSFDSYPLALNMAQFPLPIITGIGHERDFTVADLVAHAHLKTPTAVAEFIIDHNQAFVSSLQEAQSALSDFALGYIDEQKERFINASERVAPAVKRHMDLQKAKLTRYGDKTNHLGQRFVALHKNKLNRLSEKLFYTTETKLKTAIVQCRHHQTTLKKATASFLWRKNNHLKLFDNTAQLHDPVLLLKRGYSITLHNGKAVKSAQEVKPGDLLTTKLGNGELTSRVEPSN